MLLTMMASTATAWGQSGDLYYTLTPASTGGNSTPHNSYTAAATTTIDGIEWSVMGNSNMVPWRIGGKNTNTPADREVFSTTAMGSAINEVNLTVGSANNITVNSLKLLVYSDSDYAASHKIDEVSVEFEANSTLSFTPTSPNTSWATGAYYKFVFNVTVTETSNKFVQFSEAKFYAPGGSTTPSITANNVDIAYDATQGSIAYTLNNATGNVEAAVTTGDWLTLGTITSSAVPFTCSANDGAQRTATVTLSFEGAQDKVVTVTQAQGPNAPGTQNNPYTVAQARAAIDAGTGVTGVYVTGIVYEGGSNLSSGAINYWISDDGTETDKFEIYKGKSFSGNNFSSTNEVQPGDVVVVSGDITKYNSTYEFSAGSTLQSLKLVAPTFSPAAGSIASGSQVTITDLHTVGTTIYYTTDGTDPTTSSNTYSAAITVNQAMTIKAIAVKANCTNSNIASAAYTVTAAAIAPTLDPAGGLVIAGTTVTMSTTTEGATIYYTTDGSNPTTSSTQYTGPVAINENMTIKAIAAADGYNNSSVTTGTYVVVAHAGTALDPYTVADARIAIDANMGMTGVYVTGIVCTGGSSLNSGSLIYWISDDGTETNKFEIYKGKSFSGNDFSATSDIQIGDVVVVSGDITKYNSTYEFSQGSTLQSLKLVAPTFSPVAGEVASGTAITISDLHTDATIYYTTDGTEPTNESTEYDPENKPTITATTTLKAIATKENCDNSAVASAAYTVTTPAPSITVDPTTVNATAAETEGTLTVTYTNITTVVAEVYFCDANGDAATYDWIVADINNDNNVDYTIGANTGEARTAYLKVSALDDNTEIVYSELVTINQAAYVVDYASLPFNWAGGPKADLLALAGVTGSGLGSDYAASNAPYRVKFDTEGDYILIKTNEKPEVVSVGIKKLGGEDNSKIIIKESTTGESFTNVQTFELTGAANAVVNIETNVAFNANTRFVQIYFNKTGSNVGVGPISITKYVPKYAVNLNQPQQGQGTIAADKTEAAEGETVTLTATPNPGYAFESWTVLDGEAQEVPVTNNAFVMPASNVEVEATFTTLPKHNIVIPSAIENNVIVDVAGNQAYATETVTITVDAPDNKVLATLTVTGNTSTNNITIAPEVNPYVDEYTFTMPDENVTISATFTDAPSFTVSFSVNGSVDDDLEVSVTQGQSTALPTSSTLTPDGFSITGWAATNGSIEAVADPYTPTANITLYAILGQTIPHSLVINASTPNFPTSYSSWDEYNLGGKRFMIKQGYKTGGKLQWRSASHTAGAGTMYNSENLGKINTIILVYDSSDSNKNFTIKAGTTENPTGGTEIEPTTNNLIYTFDLSSGNYNYFVMTNGDGAGYLQSISIDYDSDLNINTVTTITEPNATMSTNIPETTCVVVEPGAVLTFTGENEGTADNLIIHDGGQVIVNSTGVQATYKKSVTHNPSKDDPAANWYTIASPVKGIAPGDVTNLIQAEPTNYDLYYYDEVNRIWKNHKANTIANLTNGKGYLYWNSTGAEIAFPGELNSNDVEIDVTVSGTGNLAGFNLIGNPFSHNIYKGAAGCAILNTYSKAVLSAGFYRLSNSGSWDASLDDGSAIKPGEGILVKATTAGVVTITNTASAPSSKANNDYIKFIVANSQYEDATYALFNDEAGLDKINHRNADIPMVYIPQNGHNYAIATMSDETQAFNLNFKAMTAGQYTLSFKAEGNYSYLHVIDRLTGEDIDMLLDGEYTFIASPRDDENRFIVRLRYNANCNVEGDIFAYQNGSDIIVNGEGELHIFDVMGRMIGTQHINGVQTINVNAQGVYIFKLNEKTQKIVVR